MIAFPGMLIGAAKAADMPVPEDGDKLEVNDALKETHPHFWVFCMLQLARRMTSPSEHWENARVIAPIPLERLMTMTAADFAVEGVQGVFG